jgi:hypothetical protein
VLLKEQIFTTQEDKNNNMISINLNVTKNILKLALLAILTYLIFSITKNHNVSRVNFQSEDTTTVAPKYF